MAIINILPYNLTNGTLADASQVMADFNQIVNNVNDTGVGAAGVNLANVFQQYQTFSVGFKAGGTGQFAVDSSGNLVTSANITQNAAVLTLAGTSFTNTFNADGTATIGGTWTFSSLCTFIDPTNAQNPVTVHYAAATYAAINGNSGKNFAANNLTVAGTLAVTGVPTFTGIPVCANSTSGQSSGAGTIILDVGVSLASATSNGVFTTLTVNTGTYPGAKIAIIVVDAQANAAYSTNGFVTIRKHGTAGAYTAVDMQTQDGTGTYGARGAATCMIGLDSSGRFDYETTQCQGCHITLLGYIT
jgi:hypothetical protein